MINQISNAWICGIKDDTVVPVFGDIRIEAGRIKSIHRKSFNKYLSGTQHKDKTSFDARGRVVTIPIVNFHEHIYSRLSKGLPVSRKTDNFYRILSNLWWKLDSSLDHDMTEASAQLAAMESIKNGVTYLFDHHASPLKAKGSLSVLKDTLESFNLRSVLAHETSDRNGKKATVESLEENKEFFLNHTTENTKALFGLHAPFTVSDETLERTYNFIKDYELGIHIHLCEDEADRKLSIKSYGSAPLSRLVKYNLLNNKSIIAHAVHLSKREYRTLIKHGCAVAVNIDSNLNNSVGIHNFKNLPAELMLLCGTDGMHANPVRTFKNIFLLARHSGLASNHAFARMAKIYFDQVKFVRSFFPDYGTLKKNDRADFIIWDYIPPTPINKENFWGHYIYGVTESSVNSVVQSGKFLMKNKVLLNIDEQEISKSIYKQGKRLFGKFKAK